MNQYSHNWFVPRTTVNWEPPPHSPSGVAKLKDSNERVLRVSFSNALLINGFYNVEKFYWLHDDSQRLYNCHNVAVVGACVWLLAPLSPSVACIYLLALYPP